MSAPGEWSGAFTRLAAELQMVAESVLPALTAACTEIGRCIAVLDQQWPGWREFAQTVGDHQPEETYQGCHCFCGVVHGGHGVCVGEAEPGLSVEGFVAGERIDIPVCRSCFDVRARVPA